MRPVVNIFWFRRDLRLEDNAGLFHALNDTEPVLPLFIFDTLILDQLDNKQDSRVEFILDAVHRLHELLAAQGSSIEIGHGAPVDIFRELFTRYDIRKVYTNHDYEPYAVERDAQVTHFLHEHGASFHSYKDQVIFEKDEIMKDGGEPYVVYTPYSKRWLERFTDADARAFATEKFFSRLFQVEPLPKQELADIGFVKGQIPFPPPKAPARILADYEQRRDFPGVDGTSRLGVHLRFGTISIRDLARAAKKSSRVYLGELIWREFYMMILWHFPQVGRGKAFKPAYDRIRWRNNEEEFEAWCAGRTGYPLVDAGMRQLNATGFMHNRVRMVVASFLAKHLLIDWRWGEAYFAARLLDYELASNNGGWQWAVGSGCDAAPYFRIFNPTLQAKKFDPDLAYIRRWVTDLDDFGYPAPIVEHEFARKRCLEVYGKALRKPL